MATNLTHQNHDSAVVFSVIKSALVAFSHNWHPTLVVDAARRAIPSHERPSFAELEEAIKNAKK
jgi:chemotaxis protein MotA